MPRHRAKLVGYGQALLVRRHDRREQFSGELVPEMVEEILQRAADAAVVIGRAEDQDVREVDPLLQRVKCRRVVGRIG